MNSGALQSTQEVQEPSFVAIDIYAKLVFSILNVNIVTLLFHRIQLGSIHYLA